MKLYFNKRAFCDKFEHIVICLTEQTMYNTPFSLYPSIQNKHLIRIART